MSKKEIRICNGCGKEIPMMRITLKDCCENGYFMGESNIPFGISDVCSHDWDLCLDCLDKARKNKLVLIRVKDGNNIICVNPPKIKKGKRIK